MSKVRSDILWKELLESYLYHALEIFYPELKVYFTHTKDSSHQHNSLGL
jgi:hypothetical protein